MLCLGNFDQVLEIRQVTYWKWVRRRLLW